jgi:hypothetical protein
MASVGVQSPASWPDLCTEMVTKALISQYFLKIIQKLSSDFFRGSKRASAEGDTSCFTLIYGYNILNLLIFMKFNAQCPLAVKDTKRHQNLRSDQRLKIIL